MRGTVILLALTLVVPAFAAAEQDLAGKLGMSTYAAAVFRARQPIYEPAPLLLPAATIEKLNPDSDKDITADSISKYGVNLINTQDILVNPVSFRLRSGFSKFSKEAKVGIEFILDW